MGAGGRRRVGQVLTGLGALLIVVGAVVWIADDGEEAAEVPDASATSSTASTSSSSTTTRSSTTTTSIVRDDAALVAEFFDRWARAVSDGDAAALLAVLHPVVIDLYGADQCEGYLNGVVGQPVDIEVRAVGPAGALALELDGVERVVDDGSVVRLFRSDLGTETDARVAFVDGAVRWFSDCGTPVEPTDTQEG